VGEPVRQLLCRGRVVDRQEGIVELDVADASSIELASEPLVPVDVDLDREGEPGLDPNVEEPENGIDQVVVDEEALAPRRHDPRLALSVRDPEATAGFDGGDHADEPFVDVVAIRDLTRALVLLDLGVVVLVGSTALHRESTCVLPYPLGLREDEGLQILEQPMLAREQLLHAARVSRRRAGTSASCAKPARSRS
jgi:hypothetical protein